MEEKRKIAYKKSIIVIILIFTISLDQIIKFIFINNKLAIFNTGFSWGILPNSNLSAIILTFVFFIIIIIFIKRQYQQLEPGLIYILAFIISAGISNLIDRFLYNGVVDYIDIGFVPVFNIADLIISIGVLFFCLMVLFYERKKINKSKKR